MKKPSEEEEIRDRLRESIIGLGERSIRKSYYPELQQRIHELERTNAELLKEIAERKRAEQVRDQLEIQLRQAQKMEAIGSLAGGIAHDFNNLLSAIIGYAELAQISASAQCSEGSCHVLTDLRGVLQAAARAKNLVKQILTFSRRQEGDRKAIELVAVIREGLQMLRSLIPQSIEIREDYRLEKAMVVADATQMHQIIMNLGTNAYHAMMESGGVFTVSMVRTVLTAEDPKIQNLQLEPGPFVVLRISDSGCGMERAVMERIFDPYFTTKDKDRGTGMGLAVVHGIVRSHRGHISVYSESGVGSTFQVYLPLAAEGRQETREESELRVFGGSERLLVVDDEREVLDIEQRMLAGLGYQVTAVTRPHEALRLIEEDPGRFDLVVTDMTMPAMNGAQLTRSILNVCPDMPVVLCTGFSELMNEAKARAIGVRQYVPKPVMRIEIANAVRQALDGL